MELLFTEEEFKDLEEVDEEILLETSNRLLEIANKKIEKKIDEYFDPINQIPD